MKKVAAIGLFLLLSVFSLHAEEPGPRLDLDTGMSFSIYSSFFTIDPSVSFDTGLFAAGAGLKSFFGLRFSDVYLCPYARAELGWFYLAVGMSLMAKGPVADLQAEDSESNQVDFFTPTPGEANGNMPYIALGFSPAFLGLGPGKLGFDSAIEVFPSNGLTEVVDNQDNPIGNFIGTAIGTVIANGINTVKLAISLTYSIQL
ncbi:MAG: hypothetical protein D6B26_04670 [Spirochaetaceae bacterium]|nr:MAG: hypothetical protein D6B26_04670 [Spirochaetaceae bacterium]